MKKSRMNKKQQYAAWPSRDGNGQKVWGSRTRTLAGVGTVQGTDIYRALAGNEILGQQGHTEFSYRCYVVEVQGAAQQATLGIRIRDSHSHQKGRGGQQARGCPRCHTVWAPCSQPTAYRALLAASRCCLSRPRCCCCCCCASCCASARHATRCGSLMAASAACHSANPST